MNTIVFVRRFLADYARNPVNLLMLVVVPAVFVVAAAGYLVDAAKLLSDAPAEASSVATATAGWAAAFLAGIAMYFQVSAARDADRGLVVAGLPARRLVAARLAAGLALALLVSVVALVALQLRTGIDQPARVIVGTVMFAVIYLASAPPSWSPPPGSATAGAGGGPAPGRSATNWPPRPGWDGGTGAATRCCGCCWRPYRRCSSCSPRPPPRTGRSRSPRPRTACAPRTWWTCSTCTPA